VAASTLFNATDADGDVAVLYQFFDGGNGGGQFRLGGVGQEALATIETANLASVSYHAGGAAGEEKLWVRVNDGVAWGEWASWQMQTLRATNSVAVVDAPATKNALQNEWWRLSSFVQVSDADGDAMVRFELRDNNAAAGSAHLWWNGTTYAQGATAQIEAADLSTAWVRGGANLGTDTIEIRAYDGYGFSAWESFDLRTRQFANTPPAVDPTWPVQGLALGQTVAASTLFNAGANHTDADGDTLTRYQVWDGGAGGGQWRVNGVGQPAGQAIEFAPAALGTVTYAAGAIEGSETLFVRVHDGEVWGAWSAWEMASYEPLRMTEIAGSSASNVFTGAPDRVYFGGKGVDQFTMATSTPEDQDDALFMGGVDGDLYMVQSGGTALIFENGNSANDALTVYGLAVARESSLTIGSVDGRHLLIADVDSGTAILQFNWLDPASRMEHYNLSDGFTVVSFTFEQFFAAYAAVDRVDFAWSELGELKPRIDEALAFYAARNQQVQADTNLPPNMDGVDGDVITRHYHRAREFVFPNNPFGTGGDGDNIVYWEFANAGGTHAQGHLARITSDGLSIELAASFTTPTLDNLYVLGGDVGTSHTYSVRAFDGLEWSEWADFTVTGTAPRGDFPATSARTVVSLSATPAVFDDYVGDADVSDVYEFQLAEPGWLEMWVGEVPLERNISVDLFRTFAIGGNPGEVVFQESFASFSPTVLREELAAGSYYLNVHRGVGAFGASNYELSLAVS